MFPWWSSLRRSCCVGSAFLVLLPCSSIRVSLRCLCPRAAVPLPLAHSRYARLRRSPPVAGLARQTRAAGLVPPPALRPGSSLAAGQAAAVAPRPRPALHPGSSLVAGRPGGGRRSLPTSRPASLLPLRRSSPTAGPALPLPALHPGSSLAASPTTTVAPRPRPALTTGRSDLRFTPARCLLRNFL
ncbi:hypothetical protein C2845_PM14G03310 [Panicum miliaceum]|uniref:Uncharacterized protein n=1 Tax=Panicum miliaceum TaxID=4540 RepID=A0A3L6PPM2_PANMI|nr:hypothetical protein C2845_PM14G03310 [Panicum miliaceum]